MRIEGFLLVMVVMEIDVRLPWNYRVYVNSRVRNDPIVEPVDQPKQKHS